MKVGVATKAIIVNNKNEVLLIGKSEHDEINPKTLDIPGGRLEFGERPTDGLVREIEEETGIKNMEIIGLSNAWSIVKDDLHLVGITYLVRTNNTDVVLSVEHESVMWVRPENMENSEVPSWIIEETKLAMELATKK